MSDYLDRLKQKRDTITARIQAAEAKQKTGERKRDARRKILVGAYYLDQAIKDNTMAQLTKLMDGFLTRNSDRKLFDLSDLPETKTTIAKNK
jgi:hypothetical protein